CEDLVDCSALLPGAQVSGVSALALAQQLAQPFGITVSSTAPPAAMQKILPQFNVTLGETPFDIIERVARYMGILAYDGADGNLILSQVGATRMSSGFEQGRNVEAAEVTFSTDERFSEYVAAFMATDFLHDLTTLNGGSGVFVPNGTVFDK